MNITILLCAFAAIMKVLLPLLVITLATTESAKILLLPVHHVSHIKLLARIGEMLKDHGHDVYTVISKRYTSFADDFGISSITPNLTNEISFIEQIMMTEEVNNVLVFLYKGIGLMKQHVRDILKDNATMARLQEIKFDLAIMDAAELNFPSYLIPYKLAIPYISICTRPDPWLARVPSLPSVEGAFSFKVMSMESSFFDRVQNTLIYLTYQLLQPNSYISPLTDDDMFSDLVPEKYNIGLNSLFIKSEMFLVNSNIYCMDEIRVSAPHYQYIPAIGATDAQPLPDDLKEMFHHSQHGVILLAFGSVYTDLPDDMLNKLLLAFGQMKYTVIIRHVGVIPANLPDNVYIRSWVPQNDILGHPKTKLFVTHMGNNGQIEAVYHGVPMLMMPHCCDQFINTQKAEYMGYGKSLDSDAFTAEEFKDLALELIVNRKFADNVQKCSRIIQNLPRARDTIPFWVNHILTFGGSHLKPYYMDMPLWKFLNLDVVIGMVLIIQIIVCSLCWCCWRVCRKQTHLKTD